MPDPEYLGVARATEEAGNALKRLGRLMQRIRDGWVFVEGRRDKEALEKLGCTKVLTISGTLRSACAKLEGKADSVVVLTDLDRRGDELARLAAQELEGCSIAADLETRKKLAGILRLRYFEDAKRKHDKLMEDIGEKQR